MWLDSFCTDRYGNVYLDCTPEQKKDVLDLIAFRKNAKQDPRPQPGRRLLRLPPPPDLRRLLHQQNRHRRPPIHRQHRR